MFWHKGIKLARVSKGYSQKALAKLLEVDPSYISRLEKGSRQPSLETLEQIARVLNIPLFMIVILSYNKEEVEKLTSEQSLVIGKLVTEYLIK